MRRCESQRCEQHKRQHTHRDERAFDDISHDGDKVQPHVEQGVADEVQGHVKIDEQTEHAAQADQRGCLDPIAQWRQEQHETKSTQYPITCRPDEGLRRVCAQLVSESRPEQIRKGQQTRGEDGRFNPTRKTNTPSRSTP